MCSILCTFRPILMDIENLLKSFLGQSLNEGLRWRKKRPFWFMSPCLATLLFRKDLQPILPTVFTFLYQMLWGPASCIVESALNENWWKDRGSNIRTCANYEILGKICHFTMFQFPHKRNIWLDMITCIFPLTKSSMII